MAGTQGSLLGLTQGLAPPDFTQNRRTNWSKRSPKASRSMKTEAP